uniref:Non-specific lipid-transfer protein-like protein At2g13820 n=1 Tax=Anthurium amnicola TaxID=1678845 RepID=A0A1D1YWM7_9ARAE
MASRVSSAVGLALVVMAALCSWASAQQGCAATMVNLMPCLSFITGSMSAPPAACCSQLDTIVQTQRECLCAVLTNGGPFNIPVNQTQALALPGSCNIKAAPLSDCNAAAMTPPGPASPATPSTVGDAPSPSTSFPTLVPSSTSMENTPAGIGSKTVPGGPVVGSSGRLRTHPLFFCLLVAVTSYASSVISF